MVLAEQLAEEAPKGRDRAENPVTVPDALPGASACGQIAPGSPDVQAPEDAMEDSAVIPPLATTLTWPGREARGDQPPLWIGKLVPLHTRLEAPGRYSDSSDKALS